MKEIEICKRIDEESVQIELIKMIQRGDIVFVKERPKFINAIIGYYKELWVSKRGKIKLWFEDPGFMSFSYLTFDGKDKCDEIKYSNQICLAIQTPSKKQDLDDRY